MKYHAILHEKGNWDCDSFFVVSGETQEEMFSKTAAFRGVCPMVAWYYCKNEATAMRYYNEESRPR